MSFMKGFFCMVFGMVFVVVIKHNSEPSAPLSELQKQDLRVNEYHNSMSDHVYNFNTYTKDLLPHGATNIKVAPNGWATFVWNGTCFMIADHELNLSRSGVAFSDVPMSVCDNNVDIRVYPGEQSDEAPVDGEVQY